MNMCPISTNPPVGFSNRITASGFYDMSDDSVVPVNSVSAPLIINVLDAVLSVTISPEYASIGDVVHFTVALRNGSSVPIVDIVLIIPLPSYLSPERAAVNGVPFRSDEVIRGIEIPGIGPGGLAEITFDAVVLPNSSDEIEIEAQAAYRYPLYPLTGGNAAYSCGLYNRASVTSNIATLTVFSSALDILQTADQTIVTAANPFITYRITVINRGDFPVTDITLKDTTLADSLFPGAEFVAGSVTINGKGATDGSPIDGIDIGTLAVGERAIVTFRVRVAVNSEY